MSVCSAVLGSESVNTIQIESKELSHHVNKKVNPRRFLVNLLLLLFFFTSVSVLTVSVWKKRSTEKL